MFILLNISLFFWYNGVMRALCTFGIIALFIGSAFIAPSEANVLAQAEQARAQVVTTVRGAVSSSQADVLLSVLPSPAKVFHRAVRTVIRTPVVTSKQWTSLLSKEKATGLQKVLEEIDFAARKHNPRLCASLDPATADRSQFVSPTLGDLLALCLAKVSADPERCSQIDPVSGASLKSICEGELVHRT